MAITVQEAREILGPEVDGVSDEEIDRLLKVLYKLAAELLDMQERGEL